MRSGDCEITCGEGEAGSPVTAVHRCRRRAGLEFVEKLLTTNLTSTDTTERNAGMLRVPLLASTDRARYWS
jgi:hypothetical protein